MIPNVRNKTRICRNTVTAKAKKNWNVSWTGQMYLSSISNPYSGGGGMGLYGILNVTTVPVLFYAKHCISACTFQ